MAENVQQLLEPGAVPDAAAEEWLRRQGFDDAPAARRRLLELCPDVEARGHLAPCLPALLFAVAESASPDASLLNFERFVQSVPDRNRLFQYLSQHPRAVEILVKLFVGSQFLTEILLRHPEYLNELTQHRRLAEFKPREEFIAEFFSVMEPVRSLAAKLDAIRSFQKWELLRLGACDTFGLMDMKSVTLQLALLADSVVQVCLASVAEELQLDAGGFAVLAFGKLGGEELNYSSDIDLVFVADDGAERFWGLGQQLIKALMDATANGFLYRVDMRLRPWGRSGPLVSNVEAYVDYLRKSGKLWEKQALLKARCIAGNYAVGQDLLKRLTPIVFDVTPDDVRANVIDMKGRVESHLEKTGRKWGEVKSGQGSIRDVEFVTQCLQLVHGREYPAVRSINTLDGLVRLADLDLIQADEYRRLSGGYVFLRTIEHALQLMHNKQMHSLPQQRRELDYLARRLDFPGPDEFVVHYEQHCREIRAVYEKYVLRGEDARHPPEPTPERSVQAHLGAAAASYQEQFPREQMERHLALLQQLDDETLVRVEAVPLEGHCWELTVVGYDQLGDLSAICGLLFVFGYDIVAGNVFTGAEVSARIETAAGERAPQRKFVNVFVVRPPLNVVPPAVWSRYESDLGELFVLLRDKKYGELQGRLAKRLAGALRDAPAAESPLLPVEISVDNESDPDATVLHIQADDTPGFLYELTNALSLSETPITRVQIQSVGRQVIDTLHVTDARGRKITDPHRVRELRAAIVLIKHFTQLLPSSPNPEAALLHFRELLEQLFSHPQWIEQLSELQQPDVLKALAKLLGVSDFLWDDFLKLQHSNLFPVITDLQALQQPKSKEHMAAELARDLAAAKDRDSRRRVLNAFKDREMLRVDLRHILGLQDKFGMFSRELTD
ncbi:MAG: glutamine synthetase adenylyltransferase, partial [Planctomycetaceae bacterium]